MASLLIKHIIQELKSYNQNVLIVENNDGFLLREDVFDRLKKEDIQVSVGDSLTHRLDYELRDQDKLTLLISKQKPLILEDIALAGYAIEFFLKDYLSGYHIPSVVDLELNLLDQLYRTTQIKSLSKAETLELVQKLEIIGKKDVTKEYDIDSLSSHLKALLVQDPIDWNRVIQLLSAGMNDCINTPLLSQVLLEIDKANESFQDQFKGLYNLHNSNYLDHPKIVTRILDYIHAQYEDENVALIVIDGMAYWQYLLLRAELKGKKTDQCIHSWVPSITELSRQAIFRGGVPDPEYIQNPGNENKLWKEYWLAKGIQENQIKYLHQPKLEDIKGSPFRLGLVFTDLDEKMHASEDYLDLFKLTENWITKSSLISIVQELLERDYTIFLTTDHGNIQAKSWRNLKATEKVGTYKSGSKSQRHVSYTETVLAEEFLNYNHDLKPFILHDDKNIYFKDDHAFSNKDHLVTHGGAHILEVLIPFIKITNGA